MSCVPGLLSWVGNITVILVLYRQRPALQPTDLLTLNLAFSDVGIAMFGYSRGIVEIFKIFRDEGYVIKWIWTCQVRNVWVFFVLFLNTILIELSIFCLRLVNLSDFVHIETELCSRVNLF